MVQTIAAPVPVDQRRPPAELFRDLRTNPAGLGSQEAARRLTVYGPNELTRHGGPRWPRELFAQFTQPLALLLMVAALLAWLGGTPALAVVVAVILLNAGFAFAQEMQAERAVEALAAYLPATARVLRDRVVIEAPARDLVPGDVIVVGEGDRICAYARLIDGSVTVDLSALDGESMPASRSADTDVVPGRPLDARELVFSGTACTAGLGARRGNPNRHAHRDRPDRRAVATRKARAEPVGAPGAPATWIIAIVAVSAGAAFLPIGVVAGLGWAAAISFSIGLIVANVPEGLLPTITLALAVGVRELARVRWSSGCPPWRRLAPRR
jgi:magnesium-transporting ATPase (P-type)